jgi:hypothetical protein
MSPSSVFSVAQYFLILVRKYHVRFSNEKYDNWSNVKFMTVYLQKMIAIFHWLNDITFDEKHTKVKGYQADQALDRHRVSLTRDTRESSINIMW